MSLKTYNNVLFNLKSFTFKKKSDLKENQIKSFVHVYTSLPHNYFSDYVSPLLVAFAIANVDSIGNLCNFEYKNNWLRWLLPKVYDLIQIIQNFKWHKRIYTCGRTCTIFIPQSAILDWSFQLYIYLSSEFFFFERQSSIQRFIAFPCSQVLYVKHYIGTTTLYTLQFEYN